MEDEVEFKWGVKKAVGQRNKDDKFYESFTYGCTEYSLYDSAYIYQNGYSETHICKLVKLFETSAHERKAKVIWFFRPIEIRSFLGDIQPKWNELLFSVGSGNWPFPRSSSGNKSISEKFADEIDGTKVEFFFNRIKDQMSTNPPSYQAESEKQGEQLDVSSSSRTELNKGAGSPSVSGTPTSRKTSLLKETEKGPYENPKLKGLTVESGIQPRIQFKDKPKARFYEASFPENTGDTRPYKKRCILQDGNGSISQKGGPAKRDIFGVKESRVSEKAGSHLACDKGVKTNSQLIEVTRRPDVDRRNWFKQPPWEAKLHKAQEAGKLVLLENLDPSSASQEIEDLVWSALKEKVEARMIQYSTFSNPLYGKALVIFKSKSAAEHAITELNRRYLIIAEGRPVICRRRNLRVPSKSTSFAGHLVLDKFKFQMQREEMRNAVSTSHCAQPNTIEYDLAMQWLELQTKSDLWWKALHEKQRKEMTELKIRLAKPQS